jgi:hypothetical protein
MFCVDPFKVEFTLQGQLNEHKQVQHNSVATKLRSFDSVIDPIQGGVNLLQGTEPKPFP